jgi:predicted Abi (CAAX) family protease
MASLDKTILVSGFLVTARVINPVAQINHGHFSYGYAKVVRDKFTNDRRIDVTYLQINPHGAYGVISAFFKWQAYMGDVNVKGKAFTLPNRDAIIKAPFLDHKYIVKDDRGADYAFSPLELMKHELAIMAARNRIADGEGIGVVTPYRSCIIDSNLVNQRGVTI